MKGQADGFEVDAIEKCMTIKDSNGDSIMKTICRLEHERNPETFHKIKEQFVDCVKALKCITKDVEKDSEQLKTQCEANIKMFNNICKADPDIEDYAYGKNMKKFLEKAKDETAKAVLINKKVSDMFKQTNDFFLVATNHEIREKSDVFFTFWNNLINQIDKSMPKIEAPKRPKKEGATTTGRKVDPRRAAQAQMMAEMMRKKAEAAKK